MDYGDRVEQPPFTGWLDATGTLYVPHTGYTFSRGGDTDIVRYAVVERGAPCAAVRGRDALSRRALALSTGRLVEPWRDEKNRHSSVRADLLHAVPAALRACAVGDH